jgi:hypothetical protein
VEHEGLEVVFYRNMGGEKKSIPILKTARQPTKYKYPFKVFSKLSKLPFTNSLVFVSSKLTLTQHPAPPDPKALLGRRPPPPPSPHVHPRRSYVTHFMHYCNRNILYVNFYYFFYMPFYLFVTKFGCEGKIDNCHRPPTLNIQEPVYLLNGFKKSF